MYFNMAAEERVVILTPEPTSITDAYALIKVLSQEYRVNEFSIIVNWTNSKKEAQSVFRQLTSVADRFLGFLSFNFLGYIPRDLCIPKSVRQQKAAFEIFPACRASQEFERIAEEVLKQDGKRNDGNIKFFWQDLLRL
jgi:flagellar biosynthesis protein FlhG